MLKIWFCRVFIVCIWNVCFFVCGVPGLGVFWERYKWRRHLAPRGGKMSPTLLTRRNAAITHSTGGRGYFWGPVQTERNFGAEAAQFHLLYASERCSKPFHRGAYCWDRDKCVLLPPVATNNRLIYAAELRFDPIHWYRCFIVFLRPGPLRRVTKS